MRRSSARPLRKPLSAARAHTAALINQFATPGLGSLMAGRFLAGVGQLLLASAGFALFMAWFMGVMVAFYGLINADAPTDDPNLHHERWKAGALLFAAAWLWALATSLGVLRQARANAERELRQAGEEPPVIP